MAGLGAYGGAGLGSALAESGVQAAAVNPSVTPPVSATPPPVESVMAQPPSATPISDLVTPKPLDPLEMTSMPKSAPVTADSLGYKPLTPPANMVTDPKMVNSVNAAYENSLANQQAAYQNGTAGENLRTMGQGAKSLAQPGGFDNFMTNLENTPYTYGAKTTLAAAATPVAYNAYEESKPKPPPETPVDNDLGQQFDYQANPTSPTPTTDASGQEQKYFNQQYTKRDTSRFAEGGFLKGILERIKSEGGGGESGMPAGYSYDADTGQYTKLATGGISDAQYNLGGYSDGGRLLRGPGDGVSDSIPAVIGKKQPARLADGEFVVPARIVSELGNGSTEAGARKLYAMMDRIQKARGSTVGKGKVAKNSRADKYLPA